MREVLNPGLSGSREDAPIHAVVAEFPVRKNTSAIVPIEQIAKLFTAHLKLEL